MLWWNEKLATGIEIIDEQHKSIFIKAGEILSLKDNDNLQDVKKTINFLITYVINHFGEEEKVMMQKEYPDFPSHRQEHTYFMNELYNINKMISKEGIQEDNLDKFKVLIVEWLVNHISETDKRLVDFLSNKN